MAIPRRRILVPLDVRGTKELQLRLDHGIYGDDLRNRPVLCIGERIHNVENGETWDGVRQETRKRRLKSWRKQKRRHQSFYTSRISPSSATLGKPSSGTMAAPRAGRPFARRKASAFVDLSYAR